jgi:hypothetical protein
MGLRIQIAEPKGAEDLLDLIVALHREKRNRVVSTASPRASD